MVCPDFVLNFMLCKMVQCSMNDRRESKEMLQLEHLLLCFSKMSVFGGLGMFLSKTMSGSFSVLLGFAAAMAFAARFSLPFPVIFFSGIKIFFSG